MAKPVFALVFGGLLACGLMACAGSPKAASLQPGELSSGTAEVNVAGRPSVTSHLVDCRTEGAKITIVTGKAGAGTTSTIDDGHGLAARYVEFHNVDGFTGSYWQGVGDVAPTVSVKNRTFLIEGAAMGFDSANPSARIAQNYSIRVAC